MGDLTKDFSRHEFACNCGCGLDTIDYRTVTVLQEIRDYYNQIVTVESGCRCWAHHESIYRKLSHDQGRLIEPPRDSMHLTFRAADITVAGARPQEVQSYLKMKYPDCFGIGCYSSFTHIDTRDTKARW